MYEQRLCAFVDILGFRDLISKTADNADQVAAIHAALVSIADAPLLLNDANLQMVVRPVLESNAGAPITTMIPGKGAYKVRGTAFSDSLVLTAEPDFEGSLNLIIALVLLTHRLIELGYLVRGGLASGPICHRPDLVFGPALISAYDIEAGVSNYPRIVVADYVYESFRTIEPAPGALSAFIASDLDGLRFLDFLETPALRIAAHSDDATDYAWVGPGLSAIGGRLERVQKSLASMVAGLPTKDLRRLAKYRWIASYLSRSLQSKEALLIPDVPVPNLCVSG